MIGLSFLIFNLLVGPALILASFAVFPINSTDGICMLVAGVLLTPFAKMFFKNMMFFDTWTLYVLLIFSLGIVINDFRDEEFREDATEAIIEYFGEMDWSWFDWEAIKEEFGLDEDAAGEEG